MEAVLRTAKIVRDIWSVRFGEEVSGVNNPSLSRLISLTGSSSGMNGTPDNSFLRSLAAYALFNTLLFNNAPEPYGPFFNFNPIMVQAVSQYQLGTEDKLTSVMPKSTLNLRSVVATNDAVSLYPYVDTTHEAPITLTSPVENRFYLSIGLHQNGNVEAYDFGNMSGQFRLLPVANPVLTRLAGQAENAQIAYDADTHFEFRDYIPIANHFFYSSDGNNFNVYPSVRKFFNQGLLLVEEWNGMVILQINPYASPNIHSNGGEVLLEKRDKTISPFSIFTDYQISDPTLLRIVEACGRTLPMGASLKNFDVVSGDALAPAVI